MLYEDITAYKHLNSTDYMEKSDYHNCDQMKPCYWNWPEPLVVVRHGNEYEIISHHGILYQSMSESVIQSLIQPCPYTIVYNDTVSSYTSVLSCIGERDSIILLPPNLNISTTMFVNDILKYTPTYEEASAVIGDLGNVNSDDNVYLHGSYGDMLVYVHYNEHECWLDNIIESNIPHMEIR
jgi:hypothetical protein